MAKLTDYPLGYSEIEDRRLASQAEIYATLTRDVFGRAGLSKGMSVLDVGCGVGDVSMLAASIVGPSGTVAGIDRNERSLAVARHRARKGEYENIEFIEADLMNFQPHKTFDALVGRLILLYFKEPAALLTKLLSHLKPGGIVAFQEMDMSAYNSFAPAKLNESVEQWIIAAFRHAGIATDMGPKLPSIFKEAGLPQPDMIAGQRVGSGPDYFHYEYNADTVRSLLPMIEEAKIATAAEIDVDTLAGRLREEAIETGLVSYTPRLVGAWARKAI